MRARRSRGFTLMEVILAMALSSLVLFAMMTAIHTHLRLVDKGRSHVEEAQLARALLQRIASDIRGAVRYDPLDIKKLVPELAPESLQTLAEEAGFKDMDFSDVEEEGSSKPPSESAAPQLVPGLYGNRYELQVDVSRLPRIDQFQRALVPAGSRLVDRLSDVKTVAYYVIRPETNAVAYASGTATNRRGLVRRELDRAVTSWAADQGELWEMETELEPIAPEVMAIEFLYFDGEEWFEEWDSDALGGLPVAVQIGIAIEPAGRRGLPADQRSLVGVGPTEAAPPVLYRLLVHLPASAPMTGEWMGESGEESEEGTEEAGDEESKDAAAEGDSAGSSPTDMLPPGSPSEKPPGDRPLDPGSFSPDMLPPGSAGPGSFGGRPFDPSMLRGRSFNPEMFRGRSFDPGMIRDRLRDMGVFPGRRSGGGSSPGGGSFRGGPAGGGSSPGGGFSPGGRSGGGPGGGFPGGGFPGGGFPGGGFPGGKGGR